MGGDRPTEDYQLPNKAQHNDWRPWQSLADCAKKCRSTTDCTGVTLKTTLEKGKCEMVKEGWPGSEEIVTSNIQRKQQFAKVGNFDLFVGVGVGGLNL